MSEELKKNWELKEKKNRRRGIITTTVFHIILLLIFIFFGLTSAYPPPLEGIMINFGTSETGKTQEIPKVVEEVVEVTPAEVTPTPPEEAPEEVKEEVATQDVVEAPVIEKKEEKKEEVKEKPKEKPKEPVKKPEPVKEEPKKPVEEKKVEPVKEEPKPDPRALFSGSKSDQNQPADQGITGMPGDQGVKSGDISSDNYNGIQSFGTGNSGVGYDLKGRNMLSIPPIRDESQETGKVAVRIKVDRNGNILEAQYTTKGSTTTDSHLIALAEKAARDARFNPDHNAPEEQWGTIVFTFKVR